MANYASVIVYRIDDEYYPNGCVMPIVCNKAVVLQSNFTLYLPGADDQACIDPDPPITVNTEVVLYEGKRYWLDYDGTTGINQKCSSGDGGSAIGPIRITSDDFASAKDWDGANSESIEFSGTNTLKVFANYIPRFLQEGVEWERTATGFTMLLPADFDSTAEDYEFYIFIS